MYDFLLFFREEVLRDQFGIRLQSQGLPSIAMPTAGSNTAGPNEPPQEVSPEFLAALPPEMQQEVSSMIWVFVDLLIFVLQTKKIVDSAFV